MRKLGKIQRHVLESICEHGHWSASMVCGWVWDTRAHTKRVMESLARLGLVKVRDGAYYPTERGRCEETAT